MTAENAADNVEETLPPDLATLARRYKRGIRQVWLIGAVILAFEVFLVLAAALYIPPGAIESIQNGDTPSLDTNFSTMLLTGLTLAVGFILGFLGLKRLEQFDKQIDNVRAELTRQVRDDYDRFQQVVREVSGAAVKEAISEQRELAEGRWKQFLADTQAVEERINTGLRPFAWLESRQNEVDQLVGVSTIEVAHDKVTAFFREGKVDVAISIAEHAVNSRLPGNNVDYHNLGSELGRQGQKPLALAAVELGIERFPEDTDLRADAILYAIGSGDLARAERHYQGVRAISLDKWGWRTFVFAGDILERLGRLDEAFELYERFRQQLPDDERSYSQPAQILMSVGRHREAVTLLEEGLRQCRKVGQCGIQLAECYMELGQYEPAIHAASRALESNAEAQPSSAQAVPLWYRATALDALIHRKLSEGGWNEAEIRELAFQCVLDYIAAVSLPDSLVPYDRRGPERLRILRATLIRHGIDTQFMAAAEDQFSALFSQMAVLYSGANN